MKKKPTTDTGTIGTKYCNIFNGVFLATLILISFALITLALQDYFLLFQESSTKASYKEKLGGQKIVEISTNFLEKNKSLFGNIKEIPISKSLPSQPLPATRLSLTLKGTFTHKDPNRASALIAISGQPAQLFYTGDDINTGTDTGTTLQEVLPAKVVLKRNGRTEQLSMGALHTKANITTAHSPTAQGNNPNSNNTLVRAGKNHKILPKNKITSKTTNGAGSSIKDRLAALRAAAQPTQQQTKMQQPANK